MHFAIIPTWFSVITWSLNRKCRTRGNFPIGNLWLVGRSHTYLLWWIMGSPQDSCLTCQVSERTRVTFPSGKLKRVLNENTFSRVQRGNTCRSRADAGLRRQLSAQVHVWCRSLSSIAGSDTEKWWPSSVKCYETGPQRWARSCTEVVGISVFALWCHLLSRKRNVLFFFVCFKKDIFL